MTNRTNIELLAPAKDLSCGKAAINHGADAVYIGPPKFGARKVSSNSLADIGELVKYAHLYNAKVYCTLNTILFENELEEARTLAFDVYNIGVDAIIIQDFAYFEMSLPPIHMFASTQTHNYNIERIKFLERAGANRIILARELSLNQIKDIRKETELELETFISGSLCVCLSGQCYLSAYTSNRSANRGECSQPCRLKYTLVDSKNNVIVKDKYLLSLKDLDLTGNVKHLIDSGITSFKIEGRLKDINYVKNVTGYFRKVLDSILIGNNELKKASSGTVYFDFIPDLSRTFNRGYTTYFINGKSDPPITTFYTPKSIGKKIGKVLSVGKDFFILSTDFKLTNGDGICFISKNDDLFGEKVLLLGENKLKCSYTEHLFVGQDIYRNNDIEFERMLSRDGTQRKISVDFTFFEIEKGYRFSVTDEDNNKSDTFIPFEEMEVGEISEKQIMDQISKTGNTIFKVSGVEINIETTNRIRLKTINENRRNLLLRLIDERADNYSSFHKLQTNEQSQIGVEKPQTSDLKLEYYERKIDYHHNVSNSLAEKFYRNSGVKEIEAALERSNDFKGKELMTTKFCIKSELNICPFETNIKDSRQSTISKHRSERRIENRRQEEIAVSQIKQNNADPDLDNRLSTKLISEPLYLLDNKHRFRLEFECEKCIMKIFPT